MASVGICGVCAGVRGCARVCAAHAWLVHGYAQVYVDVCVIVSTCRRAMCRADFHFIRDTELVQDVSSLTHRRCVRSTAHHDSNQGFVAHGGDYSGYQKRIEMGRRSKLNQIQPRFGEDFEPETPVDFADEDLAAVDLC